MAVGFAVSVHRDDVLVVQIARGGSFRAEPRDEIGVRLSVQHLDRDHALHTRIETLIDAAEAASSDFKSNLVIANPRDHFVAQAILLPADRSFPKKQATRLACVTASLRPALRILT